MRQAGPQALLLRRDLGPCGTDEPIQDENRPTAPDDGIEYHAHHAASAYRFRDPSGFFASKIFWLALKFVESEVIVNAQEISGACHIPHGSGHGCGCISENQLASAGDQLELLLKSPVSQVAVRWVDLNPNTVAAGFGSGKQCGGRAGEWV